MTLAAGTRLGPYEILGPVDAGGMGEVYRAEDRRLNRAVAIKVLHPHLAARGRLKQRFDREARVISSLSHPHICRLYDVGSDRGLHYLVMEYLEGETLARRLQRGPLSLAQALQYAIQIGEALDRAHRSGIVHRDVKPGNIILTKDGVKVLDFGLAKLAADKRRSDADTEAELTQEGVLLGTYSYMAPEQREGKEADARTDIFALGEILCEMLTGAKASKRESTGKTITPSAEPEPITRRWPQIPPALDHIVRTCLARDPDARWQTVHDVLIALRWVRDSGALTSPRPTARSRNKIRSARSSLRSRSRPRSSCWLCSHRSGSERSLPNRGQSVSFWLRRQV